MRQMDHHLSPTTATGYDREQAGSQTRLHCSRTYQAIRGSYCWSRGIKILPNVGEHLGVVLTLPLAGKAKVAQFDERRFIVREEGVVKLQVSVQAHSKGMVTPLWRGQNPTLYACTCWHPRWTPRSLQSRSHRASASAALSCQAAYCPV